MNKQSKTGCSQNEIETTLKFIFEVLPSLLVNKFLVHQILSHLSVVFLKGSQAGQQSAELSDGGDLFLQELGFQEIHEMRICTDSIGVLVNVVKFDIEFLLEMNSILDSFFSR